VFIGSNLTPGQEAIRTTADAVTMARAFGAPEGTLKWAVDNLRARFAAAPQFYTLRAAVAHPDPDALRDLIGRLSVPFAAMQRTADGTPQVDVYADRQTLTEIAEVGFTVEIVSNATDSGISRQDQVGRGDRFADGSLPPSLGLGGTVP
jgi:hypothetical protein